jgi:hypothetical protein
VKGAKSGVERSKLVTRTEKKEKIVTRTVRKENHSFSIKSCKLSGFNVYILYAVHEHR